MGAAMIGGTAYAAHKAGERSAMAAQQEADQEARLEAQQPAAPPPPPAAAPPPAAGGGTDIATQLQSLAQLRDQGVLSPEEFEAAKQKLLAG
jgi:putative oligomerization/nucleic acid binding protein